MGDIGLTRTIINEEIFYDLDVSPNGDLTIDENADYTDIQFLVLACRGEFRESPLIGVGIRNYHLSDSDGLAQDARLMLEADGFIVNALRVIDHLQLNIDAVRP